VKANTAVSVSGIKGEGFSTRSASPACLSRVEGAGEVANLVLAPTFPLRQV